MVAMNVWPTDGPDGSVASEARWRKMGRLWTPTGVALGVGSSLNPTLAYPNLTVKAGAAWVDGHFCELPGDQVLAVTANGLCVVRFDPAANTAQLLYLDGASVPAQDPAGTYEMPIAKIVGSALQDVRRPSTTNVFDTNADRDAKWLFPPVGSMCVTRDTGWSWIRTAGNIWVPQSASVFSTPAALGGFPAGAYTFPASPANISTYFAANQLLPGGVTAWPGIYRVQAQLAISPSDASTVTLRLEAGGAIAAQTAALAFAAGSAIAEFNLGAGNAITWQMVKAAATVSWTTSTIRFNLSFQPA